MSLRLAQVPLSTVDIRMKPTSGGTTKCTSLFLSRYLCRDMANVNVSIVNSCFHSFRRHSMLLCSRHPHSMSRSCRKFCINCTDHSPNKHLNDEALCNHSFNPKKHQSGSMVGRMDSFNLQEGSFDTDVPLTRPKRFQNRFLNFARLGSVISDAAETFFKSEIRRRLFVTAMLILVSRIGYFIPLPGFDRRLIPDNYLSFAAGSMDELGDYTSELKLSLFQLGISPQIAASILMQILCHLVPSLVKLRKEGLDGHEKIKSYMCV